MDYSYTNIFLLLLLATQAFVAYGQNSCSSCSGPGEFRFKPDIIDLLIEESTINSNEVEAIISWDSPSECCDVYYKLDILQNIRPDNCTVTMRNTSNNTAMFSLQIFADQVQIAFQVSAVYSDDAVIPGPCHFVNTSSFIYESGTIYNHTLFTDVNIPIVFQSCQPSGNFVPPSYELNGRVIHGSELSNYISNPRDQQGGHYFTVQNVTEDIVLLEYCILHSEMLCELCDHLQQDLILSRHEVLLRGPGNVVSSPPPIATDPGVTNNVSSPPTTGMHTGHSVTTNSNKGLSTTQPMTTFFVYIITVLSYSL